MSVPRPVRLAAGFFTVGVWTMASRVLGFLRDILIAAAMGAGPAAEAFFVAFTLPNMFRRLFAEGAFNTAFVPMFAKRLEDGAGEARGFAEDALAGLATVLIAFTLAAQLAMPWLVLALASGFAGDERLALATEYGRIAFPYILFISLAALLSGALNALGRFAAAAAAPVLLNLVLIGAIGVAAVAGAATEPDFATALSWAVPVAGIAQCALVWVAAGRAGLPLRLRRPRLTPELRRLVAIAIPAALAAGVMQINLVVGRQVASHFEGAVAWLWMADRVFQLPLGVVGVAIGVVLLPELSRRVRVGDGAGAANALNRAAEIALALTLPAAAALLVIPGVVVETLFERGAFGPEDTAATALALAIYAAGLPAYVLQKVAQPVFFSREDTRTPLNYALWGMAVNAALAVTLAPVVGFLAAAIGTTVAAWVNLALLWRGARRADPTLAIDARLAARLPRLALATLAMAAILIALDRAALPAAGIGGLTALVLLVVAGVVGYAAATVWLGALTRGEIRSALRRRRSGQ